MKTTVMTVVLGVFGLAVAAPASAATCESLMSLKLANATITMAQPVAAGAVTPPAARGGRGGGNQFADLPAFCRKMIEEFQEGRHAR